MRPVLALDLDATLVEYSHEGFDINIVGNPLVDSNGVSALDFIRELHGHGYELWIYTARATRPEGEAAVLRWIRKHGLDELIQGVTATKHFFFHRFVDDRAIAFTGTYRDVVEQLV